MIVIPVNNLSTFVTKVSLFIDKARDRCQCKRSAARLGPDGSASGCYTTHGGSTAGVSNVWSC